MGRGSSKPEDSPIPVTTLADALKTKNCTLGDVGTAEELTITHADDDEERKHCTWALKLFLKRADKGEVVVTNEGWEEFKLEPVVNWRIVDGTQFKLMVMRDGNNILIRSENDPGAAQLKLDTPVLTGGVVVRLGLVPDATA